MVTIGIAGGTGCGKTTVVNQIVEQLPRMKSESFPRIRIIGTSPT